MLILGDEGKNTGARSEKLEEACGATFVLVLVLVLDLYASPA